MKLTKSAEKILKDGYSNIGSDQPRLLKAMKELQALNLVDVEANKNDYGYVWYIVRNKSNIEKAKELVKKLF